MVAFIHGMCLMRVESNSTDVFPHQAGRFLSLPANRPQREGRQKGGLEALQQVEASFQDKRFLLCSHLTGEASAALRATGVGAPPTLRELT